MRIPGGVAPSPSLGLLLGLPDAVHSADGLQLVRRVEDGLHQQHVRGLDDVQPVGAGVEGQQQDVDLLVVLEGAQVLLGGASDVSPCVRKAGLMLRSHKLWPAGQIWLLLCNYIWPLRQYKITAGAGAPLFYSTCTANSTNPRMVCDQLEQGVD